MAPLRTIKFSEHANAYVVRDPQALVHAVLHTQQPLLIWGATARQAAANYLSTHADLLQCDPSELRDLQSQDDLSAAKIGYQLVSEKRQFDVATVTFQKIHLGIPVWQTAISVHLKRVPMVPGCLQRILDGALYFLTFGKRGKPICFQVLSIQMTGREDRTFERLEPSSALKARLEEFSSSDLIRQLGLAQGGTGSIESLHIQHQRLMIYSYREANRVRIPSPTIKLPAVPSNIEEGRDYLVAATYFDLKMKDLMPTHWIALVEAGTWSVLHIEPFEACVQGLVFLADPVTSQGGPLPDADNTQLDPCRALLPLQGLDAPAGVQNLTGSNVKTVAFSSLFANPPTEPPGTDFCFHVRTDDFAAVNAYYHCDRFFRLVEDLGFKRDDYFPGTEFPISVSPRGWVNLPGPGIQVNAQCKGTTHPGPGGNIVGGIRQVVFCLAETSVVPHIGIATDWRVVLHELGGHGTLQNHVNSSYFGFAHSAGDSLAAILNAPESRATDTGRTFPWIPAIGRRHDRTVEEGWCWDGDRDRNDSGDQLQREQILSSTHFRFYQSIGGGSSDINTRRFAARLTSYLILRAIKTLTPVTNPMHASDWLCCLLAADAEDWTSEALNGGAYAKVLYWAFEKQNLFGGRAPDVDVYIDDGRCGEYQYQPDYSHCPAIWNRLAADDGDVDQAPIANAVNFVYVKIKNRGTSAASSVVVKAFQNTDPSSNLYPDDWAPMKTSYLPTIDLPPASAEVKVGPFMWIPASGNCAILMAVSANGDQDNLQKFQSGKTISVDRLVPNDNNLGMRTY